MSPVAVYSECLFFIHMVQHLILLLLAPPLIWLGAPLWPKFWALPEAWRHAVSRQFWPNHWLITIGHWLVHPVAVFTG